MPRTSSQYRARDVAGAHAGALPDRRADVDQLNQRAWDVHAGDPPQALALAAEALAVARVLGYTSGTARSHYVLGACHMQLNAYGPARTELLAALDAYEALGEREPQASTLNLLGNLHSALGDHHAAYALYLRSLALRQALGLTSAEAASWNNLGNAYYHLGDYAQALEAHQRSLALKEALGDRAGCAVSFNNIGNVYKASADMVRALPSYQQSLRIARELGNRYHQAGALGNLGVVYSELGDPHAALAHHLESLAIEREIGNRHGEAESLMQLGGLFLRHPELAALAPDEADPALSYLQQALALARGLEAREIEMHSFETLAQLYAQRGDVAQAFTAYQHFHVLERDLYSEALGEKTRKLQIIHQVETAKQEVELKRMEAELAHLKNTELQALLAEADRQRGIAEEASQFKTKLLSIAAHDLRNPLTGIIGYADLLLKSMPEDPTLGEITLLIRQSAQRMAQMLTTLLDSTRIESGSLQLQIEPLELGMLAHQIVEAYQPHAGRKAQTLTLHADEACWVRADRHAMGQVLENLVSNAVKFSPPEHRIWVTLSTQGQLVRCAVRDEGPGLTAEDQRRLFGRFERLSATPTGGEASTGLGLAIVRQLVELQGGRVWAESAGPGLGTTFLIELPSYPQAG